MALDFDFLSDKVDLIFNVFKGFQTPAIIILTSEQGGWGDSEADPTEIPVNAIIVSWKQIDVERTSFYDLIQANDLIALVKGSEITQEVKTDDKVKYTDRFGNEKSYKIEAVDDTFGSLYTLLIRSA